MEAGRPDRPEVEVLDTEKPPGAFQQWASMVLRRPLVRVSVAVVAALVLVGVWATLPRDAPTATADAEAVSRGDIPPGLRPPPARGRASVTGSWQVADIAVRTRHRGHTVMFTATNRGADDHDPRELEVTGTFVDRPGLNYRGTCAAVERVPGGYRTLRGAVGARRSVLVRCTDVTRYGGRVAWIDPGSITVRRIPCESDGSSLPM